MPDLKLSLAMGSYDRILPLLNGEVKPDGITLEYAGMPGNMGRVAYEQTKYQRYDISEMSIAFYLRARSIGWPYQMLPLFHNRNFSYSKIHVHLGSGIRQGHPEELKGKRMGIKDYFMTMGLWTRGVLQMEYGIKPQDMIWYQERGKNFSNTGAAADEGLELPPDLVLNYANNDLNTMLVRKELDAVASLTIDLGKMGEPGLDRKRADVSGNPDISTLFPDPRAEAVRFFKKTGVYPPHHGTVIRESILKEHPWAAISLMEAFEESKRIAISRLRQNTPTLLVFGEEILMDLDDTFGRDPFPYGIKANARALEMAQTFSVQQGMTKEKQPLDQIFPQEIIYREEILS